MNTTPLQRGLTGWKHVKSSAIERYFGSVVTENISRAMREFYWPIFVAGTHGWVYVMPGGDFVGDLGTNGEFSVADRSHEYIKQQRRSARSRIARQRPSVNMARTRDDFRRQMLGMGPACFAFASDDAVLAAETGGKSFTFSNMVKVGVASNAIGNGIDLWTALTSNPVAGAAAPAAPGGLANIDTTTGAMPLINNGAAGTNHFRAAEIQASVINMTLRLDDKIFSVAKLMNSTATEAVTGVPLRYQNQTSTSLSYIGGNFCYPSNPTTVLPATAHNWTVCTYTNQAGTAAQSFESVAGVASCVLRGIDLAANLPGWFLRLAAGDTGVKALTQMQCSALVATGTIDFVVAHPIAWIPCYAANVIWSRDALYGRGPRLPHIEDNACLNFCECPKSATTVTNYQGQVVTVGE